MTRQRSDAKPPAASARSPMTSDLAMPSADALLEGILTLGRQVHLEMEEPALVKHFLGALSDLFPFRAICIRTLDLRSAERAHVYANTDCRHGIESEPVRIKQSALDKAGLKSALAESARIVISTRWDSPFPDVAAGVVVPLVASGELYGVLDLGYPLGTDCSETDERLLLPLANQLSVALRNERLHRDTSLLRDYQAKLIEHANALILGVDRHWRITVCNRALCELTGYLANEIIGSDIRDWLPSEEVPKLTKLVRAALNGANSDAVDVCLLTKAGGSVRTLWSIAGISGRGQVEAVVAIGQDQTRLRELQNQVIQAEKLATLGQLAAGVVHELNNPLTSITVYAEFLLRKARFALTNGDSVMQIEQGDVEKLERINAGAQRIMLFARDLVQYAKPAGDELDVVCVNHVVKQSLSFCEHLFERAGVKLREDLASDLPDVFAVPGQLEQVVINLVTNAVHAVEPGGVVTVRSFREGDMVGVRISDTGPGIPVDALARVFEPFYTTKTDGQGTGLGLSIVRNIIEQHNGIINAVNLDGSGAAFTVRLPKISRQTT